MPKTKKQHSSDDWLHAVARTIRNMRKAKGYTNYETFALDHGLDRKQYWRVENNANITIKTLVKILEIHGKDLITFTQELKKAMDEPEVPSKRKKKPDHKQSLNIEK